MKKYLILTSLLTLTACFGGGGNGGGISSGDNRAPIVVPGDSMGKVDPDSGQTLSDRKGELTESCVNADNIATDILNSDNQTDPNSTGTRHASLSRSAGVHGFSESSEYTDDYVKNTYETMNNILVNKETEGKTNRQILVSLALSGMDKNDILELLGNDQDKTLDDKIDALANSLKTDTGNDKINEIKDNADKLYKQFGKEFKLTLDHAIFYHNSIDTNSYTFTLDNNKKVKELVEKDGRIFKKQGQGIFANEINGIEYSLEKTQGSMHVKVDLAYNHDSKKTETEIRQDLIEAIKSKYGTSSGPDLEEILNWVGSAQIGDCEDCIKKAKAHYTEKVAIESGGKDLGLKYADFGLRKEIIEFYNDNEVEGAHDITYQEHGGFVGGYNDNKADLVFDDNTQEMVFTGKSYVGLTRKLTPNPTSVEEYKMPENMYYTGTAKLTAKIDGNKNITQDLVADFKDKGWYTVTISDMPYNGSGGTFTFDDNDKTIDEKWQVNQDKLGELENKNIKYYGPTSDYATEVAGFVQYIEDKNSDSDWTFKADITFGGKKE